MRFLLTASLLLAGFFPAHAQTATKDWRTIDADSFFTFRLPADFVKTNMMGVENYLGEYYQGETRFLFIWRDTASFEYDSHSMSDVSEVDVAIDGKRGSIRTFSITRNNQLVYIAELNIGNRRDGDVQLYMGLETKNRAGFATANEIFRSVKFSRKQSR
jgi:hypothetical protein